MGYLGIGAILYFIWPRGDASTALFVASNRRDPHFYGGGFATIPAYLKDLFGGCRSGRSTAG